MDIRIYLFTGFLDSGKSTFIQDTILNTDFCDNETTVLIVCEQGEISYSLDIANKNVSLVTYEANHELTQDDLDNIVNTYNPSQIIIEFNGMHECKKFVDEQISSPYVLAQVLTTINASTFLMYLKNMRSFIYQHVVFSDLVIFNRLNDSTRKITLRNAVRAINTQCQIIYENEDGSVETTCDEIPFDLSLSFLDISDYDFGLFCYDALEHPERYLDKHVCIRGKFMGKDSLVENGFILGRETMVCCEDDTSLIGMICEHSLCDQLMVGEWIEVSGRISIEYDYQDQRDYCLLHVDDIKVIQPINPEYVTFS